MDKNNTNHNGGGRYFPRKKKVYGDIKNAAKQSAAAEKNDKTQANDPSEPKPVEISAPKPVETPAPKPAETPAPKHEAEQTAKQTAEPPVSPQKPKEPYQKYDKRKNGHYNGEKRGVQTFGSLKQSERKKDAASQPDKAAVAADTRSGGTAEQTNDSPAAIDSSREAVKLSEPSAMSEAPSRNNTASGVAAISEPPKKPQYDRQNYQKRGDFRRDNRSNRRTNQYNDTAKQADDRRDSASAPKLAEDKIANDTPPLTVESSQTVAEAAEAQVEIAAADIESSEVAAIEPDEAAAEIGEKAVETHEDGVSEDDAQIIEARAADIPASEPEEEKVEIIGVRFKKSGKIYYFDPSGFAFEAGGAAIVETARGLEFGSVVIGNRFVRISEIVPPLRKVIRVADETDISHHAENEIKEVEAFNVGVEKIAEHRLAMKLVDVEYTFDNNKLLFYFTADGRIDFRELVKDLAAVFRTRIEMRQIGIRDEAKIMGGLGVCGRPFCCHAFLGDFVQVSIKMAKEQNLSLNSNKISGACGRLMCCLRYEYDVYDEELRKTPRIDSIVETPDGDGVVIEVMPLAGMVKVRLQKETSQPPKVFHRDVCKVKGFIKRDDGEDDDADKLDE